LKPAVLKCDQGLSASFSKFKTTSVRPAVYTRSDLHSCSPDFIRFDRSLVTVTRFARPAQGHRSGENSVLLIKALDGDWNINDNAGSAFPPQRLKRIVPPASFSFL
jgi:hypothetical protein